MKTLLILLLISTNAFSEVRVRYVRAADGTLIPIVREVKETEKRKGIGMDFIGEVQKTGDNEVKAYVGGCGYVSLGSIVSKDSEGKEVTDEKLKSLQNKDRVSLKFKEMGKCNVAEWWK